MRPRFLLLLLAFVCVAQPLSAQSGGDRLYGRVLTVEGQSFEGFLRWDRNEATANDFLDGRKVVPLEYLREAASLDPDVAARQRAERTIVAFGMRISWDEDDQADPFATGSALRMAHIRTLERADRRVVRATLRDGGLVELRSASSDIGPGMRGLVIERARGRDIELDWHEIERVDLFDRAQGEAPEAVRRLHGTVTTWADQVFTGSITWDLDESIETDILDGEEGAVEHEIPFSDIARIEWESDRAAIVTTRDGVRRELRGTNDVNRQNRGIEVAGAFGRATVAWEDFKDVRFHADDGTSLTDFEPSAPLRGTVHAVDGRVIEGVVRWDNDEEYAWEVLDGWLGDADVDVEFGLIASIEKVDEDRVAVILWDGSRFELEDTNDVGEGNNGVFVQPDGRSRRLVRWSDFARVDFDRPGESG